MRLNPHKVGMEQISEILEKLKILVSMEGTFANYS